MKMTKRGVLAFSIETDDKVAKYYKLIEEV